jgi:hypothetical protein
VTEPSIYPGLAGIARPSDVPHLGAAQHPTSHERVDHPVEARTCTLHDLDGAGVKADQVGLDSRRELAVERQGGARKATQSADGAALSDT